MDDIVPDLYMGRGTFAQVGTLAQPLLQDVAITHITAFPTHILFNIGAPETVQIAGFTFTNSIVVAGSSPVTSTGSGLYTNCARDQNPLKTINKCFSNYQLFLILHCHVPIGQTGTSSIPHRPSAL